MCTAGRETVEGCPQDCAWKQVSAGAGFTCAVKADGSAWCWGGNDYGQLGNDGQDDSPLPVKIGGGVTGVVHVSAGATHACAVVGGDGALYCWGDNSFGQLGDGTVVPSHVPRKVDGLPPIREVSAGLQATCAVDWDGDAWCWGQNDQGQLGLGFTSGAATPFPTPQHIEGLHGLVGISVSAGSQNACAVDDGRGVWCWGANFSGQLGDGSFGTGSATPVKVVTLGQPPELLHVDLVSSGLAFACGAVDILGPSLYCWGDNSTGQLGIGTTDATQAAAVAIEDPEDVSSVSCGFGHACAVRLNGRVVCWGDNSVGTLGLGGMDPPVVRSPTELTDLADIVQLDAGALHTCALDASGALFCWGDNATGELGDGTTIYRYAPVRVSDP